MSLLVRVPSDPERSFYNSCIMSSQNVPWHIPAPALRFGRCANVTVPALHKQQLLSLDIIPRRCPFVTDIFRIPSLHILVPFSIFCFLLYGLFGKFRGHKLFIRTCFSSSPASFKIFSKVQSWTVQKPDPSSRCPGPVALYDLCDVLKRCLRKLRLDHLGDFFC